MSECYDWNSVNSWKSDGYVSFLDLCGHWHKDETQSLMWLGKSTEHASLDFNVEKILSMDDKVNILRPSEKNIGTHVPSSNDRSVSNEQEEEHNKNKKWWLSDG